MLMVTRFNNKTWEENVRWRENNHFQGCIYNSPVYIKEDIPLMITFDLIEMNNNTNKIIRNGKIINKVHTDRNYRIYEERNYNRYTYKGKTRIDRKDIELEQLENLEAEIFKGKTHLKRGQGISKVSHTITKKYLEFIEKQF